MQILGNYMILIDQLFLALKSLERASLYYPGCVKYWWSRVPSKASYSCHWRLEQICSYDLNNPRNEENLEGHRSFQEHLRCTYTTVSFDESPLKSMCITLLLSVSLLLGGFDKILFNSKKTWSSTYQKLQSNSCHQTRGVLFAPYLIDCSHRM